MKKHMNGIKLFLAMIFLLLLVGCSSTDESVNADTPNEESTNKETASEESANEDTATDETGLYNGRELTIAVFGDTPKVKEKQINFKELTFAEFNEESLQGYEGVFITEENFSKAIESQHIPLYLEADIPFFFIDGNEEVYQFIQYELLYGDAVRQPYADFYVLGFYESSHDGQHVMSIGDDKGNMSTEDEQEAITWVFNDIEKETIAKEEAIAAELAAEKAEAEGLAEDGEE